MSAARVALVLTLFAPITPAHAQAMFVYRLGSDTVAVEQYTRTATRLAGEVVTRTGPSVLRTQYDITLANGRTVAATVRRRQADGQPIPNTPSEWRFAFTNDSVRRDVVWSDSVQSRTFAVRNALVSLPVPAFGPVELWALAARRPGVRSD